MILIALITITSCTNYKYNKAVKEKNEMTEMLITNESKEQTNLIEYLAAVSLFIVLIVQIKKI